VKEANESRRKLSQVEREGGIREGDVQSCLKARRNLFRGEWGGGVNEGGNKVKGGEETG
jgi:hypothetical protein